MMQVVESKASPDILFFKYIDENFNKIFLITCAKKIIYVNVAIVIFFKLFFPSRYFFTIKTKQRNDLSVTSFPG